MHGHGPGNGHAGALVFKDDSVYEDVSGEVSETGGCAGGDVVSGVVDDG